MSQQVPSHNIGATAPAPQNGPHPGRTAPPLLVWRALRRRCPRCGAGGIFRRWVQMLPRCPRCDLDFEQGEQGYIVGAYMLNIVAAELIFMALFLGVLVLTWPTPPWTAIQWLGAPLVVIAPIVTYPLSKTLFLAMHLAVFPSPGDNSTG